MDFSKAIELSGAGQISISSESSGPLYTHPFVSLATETKTSANQASTQHQHQQRYLTTGTGTRRPLLVHTGSRDHQFDLKAKHYHHKDHQTVAGLAPLRNQELLALKNAYSSLNSDISCSSVSSVESLLELRRENPEEILLALGFGGASYEENFDPLLRIPCRFFEHQSKAKGVHVGEVIQKRKTHLMRQRSIDKLEHDGHYRHLHSHETVYAGNSSEHRHSTGLGKQHEPLRISVKQSPKLLVMGSKSYEFECGESDLYSPKTCAIHELANSPAPSFPPSVGRHSPAQFAISQLSPNLSHHSSENLLSVPMSGHRKLSCPNIDFELAHHSSREQLNQVDDYIATQIAKSQSGSIEHLAHSSHTSHLSSVFDQHSESLDRLSLNLTSLLTSDGSSNSNLNFSYFIEAALITSIQSLKLSLDFYRYFMLVKSDSTDSGTGTLITTATDGTDSQETSGSTSAQQTTTRSKPSNSFEGDKQRLILQNLYLDVLEVETMLYDCLAKFKNSPNWPIFVSKYIHQLQKAVDKISQIQESLRRLNSRYCRPFGSTTDQ